MLKIDCETKTFSKLDNPTLAEVALTERCDLQEFISNSPEAFFADFGLELFLVGKEFGQNAIDSVRLNNRLN
jgi:hypothetical protein